VVLAQREHVKADLVGALRHPDDVVDPFGFALVWLVIGSGAMSPTVKTPNSMAAPSGARPPIA
jgi:hypothetical protein